MRSPNVAARRASGSEDAEALVELRAVMYDAMGVDPGGIDAAWRGHAAAWFARALQRREVFAAFLVDDGDGVAACAVGLCVEHAPGPQSVQPLRGEVFNVATAAGSRRRGYARACLTSLVDWFRDDTQVEVLELAATSDGSALYHSLGFVEHTHPSMRLRLPSWPR